MKIGYVPMILLVISRVTTEIIILTFERSLLFRKVLSILVISRVNIITKAMCLRDMMRNHLVF